MIGVLLSAVDEIESANGVHRCRVVASLRCCRKPDVSPDGVLEIKGSS
jgi:hypothetical protein